MGLAAAAKCLELGLGSFGNSPVRGRWWGAEGAVWVRRSNSKPGIDQPRPSRLKVSRVSCRDVQPMPARRSGDQSVAAGSRLPIYKRSIVSNQLCHSRFFRPARKRATPLTISPIDKFTETILRVRELPFPK
jgi:hypothetical protein